MHISISPRYGHINRLVLVPWNKDVQKLDPDFWLDPDPRFSTLTKEKMLRWIKDDWYPGYLGFNWVILLGLRHFMAYIWKRLTPFLSRYFLDMLGFLVIFDIPEFLGTLEHFDKLNFKAF